MLNRFGFLILAATAVLVRGAAATQAVASFSVGPDSALVDSRHGSNRFAPSRSLLLPGVAARSLSTASPLLVAMPAVIGHPPSHRGRHALIGGLIGGAAGIVVCTTISNIAKDKGSGFSTCDAKAYLGFGLGGAALGALIGWVI